MVLTFAAWVDWAKANENLHLNYFNLTNEIKQHHAAAGTVTRDLFDRTKLPAGVAAFADYLDSNTGTLDRALGDFSKGKCTHENCASEPLKAQRPLVGVKSYGGLSAEERKKLSLSSANCTDAVLAIDCLIDSELNLDGTPHNFSDEAKHNIGDVIRTKFSISRSSARPAAASAATPTGGVRIAPTSVAQELIRPNLMSAALPRSIQQTLCNRQPMPRWSIGHWAFMAAMFRVRILRVTHQIRPRPR